MQNIFWFPIGWVELRFLLLLSPRTFNSNKSKRNVSWSVNEIMITCLLGRDLWILVQLVSKSNLQEASRWYSATIWHGHPYMHVLVKYSSYLQVLNSSTGQAMQWPADILRPQTATIASTPAQHLWGYGSLHHCILLIQFFKRLCLWLLD